MALHISDREIVLQFALAYDPRLWAWWPRIDRTPPAGWRGGFAFTWLFVHVQRWWRYV